jgi:hypothetical protein
MPTRADAGDHAGRARRARGDALGANIASGRIAIVLALLLAAASVHGAHPFITDDTRTQGSGHFELQLGTQYTRTPADAAQVSLFEFQPQVTYGAIPELDIIVRPSYDVLVVTGSPAGRSSGFAETVAAIKWRFASGEVWSVALGAGTGIPSGNAAFDSTRSTPRALLLVTGDSKPVEFDLNVGVVRNTDGASLRTWLGHVSALTIWHATERLQIGADFALDQNPLRNQSQWPAAALVGAIWKANVAWDLDAGYQRGLNHSAPRNQWLLGATLRW